jgi:hypothetical protein
VRSLGLQHTLCHGAMRKLHHELNPAECFRVSVDGLTYRVNSGEA